MRDDPHWWRLKDKVKARCQDLCEFCLIRHGVQLHHRHYETWLTERPEDVMLVCDACHRLISGKAHKPAWPLTFAPGSLGDWGYDGKADTPPWRWWLASASTITLRIAKDRDHAEFKAANEAFLRWCNEQEQQFGYILECELATSHLAGK
jgi:hypothetical protein